jgi:tetratricopeptide (TPR) repeat protein
MGQMWPVPAAAEGKAGRIRDWVEAMTGMRRLEDGSIQLLEVGDWEAMVARLGDWQPVAREDRRGWNRREARIDEMTGRWWAARWHLDRLIEADPQAGGLYLRRGQAALAIGDLSAARRDFDKAVALLPEEWGPWFMRGRVAYFEGRWHAAIADLDKALLLRKPQDEVSLRGPRVAGTAAILLGRGHARASLGQWKEAANDFAAVVGNPFEKTSLSNSAAYALVLLKNGDLTKHRAVCKQMLDSFAKPENEPKSTIVTSEFGFQEVHNYGKPFDSQEAVTIAWACCLSPELPNYAPALRLAQRAASLDKKSYLFARAYGAALYRATDYEAAIKQLETAVNLRPQPSPSVWLLLAMAQQQRQKKDQAKEWLSKARTWIAKARNAKPGNEGKDDLVWDRLPWTERLALELLESEAVKLIESEPRKK